MKRKFIYIIAIILSVVYVGSEYYIDLSIENTTSLNDLDQERYLDTKDIDSYLNDENNYLAIESLVDLTLNNIQNDKEIKTYTYKITINNVYGAYRYTLNKEEKYLIFSANGEAELSLKSNETVIIYDLPQNESYTIEQIGGDTTKYTIKANNVVGTTTKGKLDTKNVITFENKTQVKEHNKNPENPYTADIYTLAIILFIITTIIFLSIKHIKIKRFE